VPKIVKIGVSVLKLYQVKLGTFLRHTVDVQKFTYYYNEATSV